MISSLLWFGLIALFFMMMMRGGCGGHVMGHGHHDHGGDASRALPPPDGGSGPARETAFDPVCGMAVTAATAKSSVYRGTVYYFCSAEHRDAFESNPEAYLSRASSAADQQEKPSHGS